MANPWAVPYFNWFAERAQFDPDIKLSFVCLYTSPTNMISEVNKRGCDGYWVYFDTQRRARSMWKAFWKLRKLYRIVKPDIVHTHLFDDGFPGMLAAWSMGIKVRIHTKQSTGYHWYHAPSKVKYDRLLDRAATHLIAVSEEGKEFLIEKEKAPAKKISLIHHGIDFSELTTATPEQVEQVKQTYGLEGKKVIITIARYIEWKGYRYLIEAAETLSKEFPDLVFLGLGRGEQEHELNQLIADRGLKGKFILTGWIDKALIPAFLQTADIYAHAAHMEPFGFVIPEAMLNRIPVVSTPTGSARDAITHLVSGYICEYLSPKSLEEGIRYMLTHDTTAITENAYKKVISLYSADLMFNNYLNLYKSAAKKARISP
jgi:glycosyltransferase involved in cell wall biosynthesis